MTLAIVLLGVGLLLIVAEILFPSFGILGVLATASIVGSIISAFAESSTVGFNFLIATAVLAPVVMLVGLKLLPHSPVAKHLVASGFSFEDTAGTDRRDEGLVGEEGPVEAALRPAGIARLAGRRVDVVTRGELVDEGARVRVIEVRGNRVVVTELRPAQDTEQPEVQTTGGATVAENEDPKA